MKKGLVYTIAFLGGAVFLGLEISASRVLAPYFGNSIYVWGSLISVFLLSLSVGYYYGGVLADKRPSLHILAVVVGSAGIFVLALSFFYLPVSRFIVALDMDLRLSLLLACLAFFLVPSVLLGMVSPFVVKLNATEFEKIGQAAGNIYSVSTMGSIFGGLGVSFFLIPIIGTRMILYLSAGVLMFTSLLCIVANKLKPA